MAFAVNTVLNTIHGLQATLSPAADSRARLQSLLILVLLIPADGGSGAT